MVKQIDVQYYKGSRLRRNDGLALKKILLVLFIIIITGNCYAGLPDPTRPADFNAVNAATIFGKGLSVDAIFYSSNEQSAIINGQTLHAGDSIAGFKLMQIKPHAVVVAGPEGIIELPLVNLSIKQAVKNGATTQ